jgi:hypothetical protein
VELDLVISLTRFMGDAYASALPNPGTLYIHAGRARFWALRSGFVSPLGRVVLEDYEESTLPYGPGCTHFAIWNTGASNSFEVRASDDTTVVATIAAGEVYEFNLGSTEASAGADVAASRLWVARKRLRINV